VRRTGPRVDFAPFEGDGRKRIEPMRNLQEPAVRGADSKPLTRSQCRDAIQRFVDTGMSAHSGAGNTLWVVIAWCEHHNISYAIDGAWGWGWEVRRLDDGNLGRKTRPHTAGLRQARRQDA
jgi:hypothetical protein